jgi:YbbR domain-containing protein
MMPESKDDLRSRIAGRMKRWNLKKTFAFRAPARLRVSNTGLRALSLIIAIGLWVFVNAGERGSVQPITVPISYRSLPRGMVIMNHPPDFVKIEITGPRTILSLVNPERLALKLDLSGVAFGQSEFKVFPSMFNTPRGTTVTSISPDQLALDVDHIVSREVPVHLAVQGKVTPGYQISSVELTPPSVIAIGPSRFVAGLTSIATEPLDLHGLNADADRAVDIFIPNPAVRFSTARVEARLDISEAISDREFRGVSVEVKDSDFKFRVEPRQATLTIRGPAVKLAGLGAKGLAYVDAKGVEPGSHELPVQVTLPDGMQLVRASPEKVRLRTYRERRTAAADEHPS